MSLSADQKVNMSLDDIVKANKKAAPKKKSAAAGGGAVAGASAGTRGRGKGGAAGAGAGAGAVKAKVNPAAAKGKRVRTRGNAKMAVAERATKVVKDSNKMDQSVGQGKAKRDAAIAQRRGLNATGKATRADIKQAVKKQAAKGARGPKATKGAPAPQANGLKISFKPAELGRTTDKNVQLQIKAVLSKGRPGAAPKPAVTLPGNNKKAGLPKPKSKVILR